MRWPCSSRCSISPNCATCPFEPSTNRPKDLSQSHPEAARAALEKILTLTDDAALKQQIPKVLRDMDVKQP